ncbi:MAG: hypothetical protein HQL24_08285 [Candidatus Omnitrophica bacterium]|nr:hypothetical protein [Candidatus Omnitrophota bacterium]
MKKYLLTVTVFFLLCGISFAGQVSLTTYYPAPFANYSQIRLVPSSSQPTCDSNHIGVLYVNTSGELQYCSSGGWSQQSAVWNIHTNSQNGGMHVVSPLNDVAGLSVGIGAANPTPGVKLQIGGDANGILEGEGPVSGLMGGTAVLIRPAGFFRDVYLALAAYGNDSSSHTAGITFGTTNNPAYGYINYWYHGTKDKFEDGKLQFSAKGYAGTSMVLNGNGNVGIGETNPQAKLVVKGPVVINGGEEANAYEYTDANGNTETADLSVNGVSYFGNVTIGRDPYEFTDENGYPAQADLSVNGVSYFGNTIIASTGIQIGVESSTNHENDDSCLQSEAGMIKFVTSNNLATDSYLVACLRIGDQAHAYAYRWQKIQYGQTSTAQPMQIPLYKSNSIEFNALMALTNKTATAAFASLSDKIVIAKDLGGNAYWPTMGIDDIGNLTPGKVYNVQVSEDATFSTSDFLPVAFMPWRGNASGSPLVFITYGWIQANSYISTSMKSTANSSTKGGFVCVDDSGKMYRRSSACDQ